ncbi:MAG: enolase C-terminal domain-like protein [Caldilineaceae bacterium]
MNTITKVDVFPVRLPVIKSFTFASGSAGAVGGTAPHIFVKVTDRAGNVGWGEGRPVPQWSYETLETVTSTIRSYLGPALLGHPSSDRWGLQRKLHATIGRGPSTGQPIAKAAVDMALHDLCARAAGLSLRAFLGGSDARNVMDLSYTLTGHDAASIREEMAEGKAAGFRHFNFKAAVAPATDIEVAETVRSDIPAGGFLWADANQGFQLHNARRVASAFEAIGVDLLEQPLPADQRHLLRALRQSTKIPLAIDEASVSPGDFFHYVADGLVDYLVIKVTRSGGIWPTLQQIALAEAAGLPLLVSGLTDGFLTKLAVCQVALAFGFAGPAALNGSQFTDESMLFPTKATLEYSGAVHLSDAPGIGLQPDEAALRDLAA